MKRNPSALDHARKNKHIDRLYQTVQTFYSDAVWHRFPPGIKRHVRHKPTFDEAKSGQMTVAVEYPSSTAFLELRYSSPKTYAELHKKSGEGSAGITSYITDKFDGESVDGVQIDMPRFPRPTNSAEAKDQLIMARALIDHEFIHFLQDVLRPFASGRYPKGGGGRINIHQEHKAYAEYFFSGIGRIVDEIATTPLRYINKETFNQMIEFIDGEMKDFKLNRKMRKLIWTDIFRFLGRIKPRSKIAETRLTKAGF